MAPRKKPAISPDNPQNLAATEAGGVESEPQDAIAAINALAGTDAGQDWEIQVYQILGAPSQGAKQPWLFNIDVSELRDLRFGWPVSFPRAAVIASCAG